MIAYFQNLGEQFAHPYTAVAQLVGFGFMFLGFFVFRNVSRNTSIVIKAVCDALAAVHFAMLGQWTGCVVSGINIGRGICFSQRGKRKWASGLYMPILFLVLTIGGSLLGWTGWESVLPMVGSCLAVMGYWCKDTAKLRLFNLVGISLWLIYGVIVMSVPTIIGDLVYIVSILLTMIRTHVKKEGSA